MSTLLFLQDYVTMKVKTKINLATQSIGMGSQKQLLRVGVGSPFELVRSL